MCCSLRRSKTPLSALSSVNPAYWGHSKQILRNLCGSIMSPRVAFPHHSLLLRAKATLVSHMGKIWGWSTCCKVREKDLAKRCLGPIVPQRKGAGSDPHRRGNPPFAIWWKPIEESIGAQQIHWESPGDQLRTPPFSKKSLPPSNGRGPHRAQMGWRAAGMKNSPSPEKRKLEGYRTSLGHCSLHIQGKKDMLGLATALQITTQPIAIIQLTPP